MLHNYCIRGRENTCTKKITREYNVCWWFAARGALGAFEIAMAVVGGGVALLMVEGEEVVVAVVARLEGVVRLVTKVCRHGHPWKTLAVMVVGLLVVLAAQRWEKEQYQVVDQGVVLGTTMQGQGGWMMQQRMLVWRHLW